MKITDLKNIIEDKEYMGRRFSFCSDLMSDLHRKQTKNITYMVVRNGILDLNETYDVIQPTDEMLKQRIVVLDKIFLI